MIQRWINLCSHTQIIQPDGEDREVKRQLKSNVITLLKGLGLLWRHRGGVGQGGTIKESFIKELNIEQELMEVRK